MPDILEVWARDVNDRGGLDGHPVKLIVVDDGGSPSRHVSILKDLVENRGVIAFVGLVNATSESEAATRYLEDRGIPVIGGSIGTQSWSMSPMFFPQGTNHLLQFEAHVTGSARLRPDARKWGQLTCREGAACVDARNTYPQQARSIGLEVVYEGEGSIAQVDFTSECLRAKSAEAELFAVAMDAAGVRRVAQSCARQDYHPTFVIGSVAVGVSQNGDENLEGAVGVIMDAPWMATSVPAVRAMHDAVQKYHPSLTITTGSTPGWAAGKLLEAAVAAAGGLGPAPSPEQLTDGLHRLEAETLGGVSPPLTFPDGGGGYQVPCWFALEFLNGAWQAANEGQHVCP